MAQAAAAIPARTATLWLTRAKDSAREPIYALVLGGQRNVQGVS